MKRLRTATELIAIASLMVFVSSPKVFATWLPDGTVVCQTPMSQGLPQIASDGAGGAIIVWQDWRNWNDDIYAQRMGPYGDPLWFGDGIAVWGTDGDQVMPQIASDGAGGAIATWADYRDMASGAHIYAQRISPGGELVGVDDSPSPPAKQRLEQNVPNPFNPLTEISFTMTETGRVRLAVYDLAGKQVRVLLDDVRQASRYELTWDGKDGMGRTVASGLYFYKLETEQGSETRKMILLR